VSPDAPDPAAFAIDVTPGADGSSTIVVTGELDLAKADEFAAVVRDALAGGSVLVDLRELMFMDSAGVRALNTALREASESGHELRVMPEMRPNVTQILELTGMMQLLRLDGDSP
jgi:anti-anti-sigma factor